MASRHDRRAKSSWVTGALLAFSLVFAGTLGIPAAGAESAGNDLFLAQKCNMCHSVEGAGIQAKTTSEKMRGPDLTEVTTRQSDEFIGSYLRKETEQNGKKHAKAFKGSDEELAALLTWFHQLAEG